MILITGATGNVGRSLVAQLLARGAKVRATSRHPNTAGLPDGAEVVEADPSRPDSLRGCLDGITAIFLNARAVQTAALKVLTLAKRAGVVRAVALAAGNVDEDHARQPSRWRGDFNAELEQAVIASGLEWVSLRPNAYASNFLGLWAAQLRTGNVIRAPYGASQHAPIDERDIAAVAVEALLTDRLLRQNVPLTGPGLSRPANSLTRWPQLSSGRSDSKRFHQRRPAKRCWLKVSPKASSPGTCCCKPRR